MAAEFHLSLGVKSIEHSVDFFTRVLGARVAHRDPTGYVNVDLYGAELTLKPNAAIDPNVPDLHFGINLGLAEFDDLAARVLASGYEGVVQKPKTVDAGTAIERKKMYLRCPTGYLVELKGYPGK